MKILISLIFIFLFNSVYSYEVIRDPFYESYFKDLSKEFSTSKANVYLIENDELNAFVINDSIYFTTGMIKNIEHEDMLKSIYFHEAGHVHYNHYEAKVINIETNKNKKIFNNLLSIGVAILSSDAAIGLATGISLDNNLLSQISDRSIRFEIQADNYMFEKINENQINTEDLINFFNRLPDSKDNFFKSHPTHADRIILLKRFIQNKKKNNSINFEWIKAKYGLDSNVQEFNNFFKNLEKGVIKIDNLKSKINDNYINYEIYKKGMKIKNINDMFLNIIEKDSNTYLKIEFFNYIIDNNIIENFELIEKNKHNIDLQEEYFFYYIYGKYYKKIKKDALSNFYFCQFYSLVKVKDKINYFCKKYDKRDISELDKSYALFK